MKKFKIKKDRISKLNIITIDDVDIKLTGREISKLCEKLESFIEVETIKEHKNFPSTKNFWAKMAQE